MTRDDIICIAREADLFEVIDDDYKDRGDWRPAVERFAALVAAAEREECAKVCDARMKKHQDNYGGFIGQSTQISEAGECADAIRARGKNV